MDIREGSRKVLWDLREMNMEIRSVDRKSYLELEDECTTPAHLGRPCHISLKVTQSAGGFTGTDTSVWVSQLDVERFIEDLQELPTQSPAILPGIEGDNQLWLEIQIDGSDIVLESTLTKRYPCTTSLDCVLQSRVAFKIDRGELGRAISGLRKLCGLR